MDSQVICPMEVKIQARDFPLLLTLRKLRKLLGLVNIYHCFVPSCAQTLQPLHDSSQKDSTTHLDRSCHSRLTVY